MNIMLNLFCYRKEQFQALKSNQTSDGRLRGGRTYELLTAKGSTWNGPPWMEYL